MASNQYPPVTEPQIAQWREFMAVPGRTYTEAARVFGVHRGTVAKYAPVETGYTAQDHANWEAALDEGYGYKHVGEMYGVDEQTVAKRFPGRGWTNEQIREHAALMRGSKARVLS